MKLISAAWMGLGEVYLMGPHQKPLRRDGICFFFMVIFRDVLVALDCMV